MTSTNSPTPSPRTIPKPTVDTSTPIQPIKERRKPGRPPKTTRPGSFGRGGGISTRSTHFDPNLEDNPSGQTTQPIRSQTPSPILKPPPPPAIQPQLRTTTQDPQRPRVSFSTLNKPTVPTAPNPTRPTSPLIIETVNEEGDTSDESLPDLVPDMFQNTSRNLSKTSFGSDPDDITPPSTMATTTHTNTNTIERLTDPDLLQMTTGKTRMTRLLNTFGFTVEPFTITLLDDLGAKDDHAIMDLTSWDPNTLYDILNAHHILRQNIPNPTTRLYYLCHLLTTLKLIRTYLYNT